MEQRKKLQRTVIIYFVIFYAVWAAYTLLITPHTRELITNKWVYNICASVVKAAVWVVPSLLIIRKYNDELHIKSPDMYRNKFRIEWVMVPVILGVYAALTVKLTYPPVWADIIVYLMAGFAEELLFRGLLLNAFVKGETVQEQLPAVLVTSFLFAAIHYPVWTRDGLISTQLISGTIFIALLGAVFAFTFLKSRNIVLVMAAHAVYDLVFIFAANK